MHNLIAVGNALVDTEYSLGDEILAQTGLTRGMMTLADTKAQTALFGILDSRGITPSKQASGGSAANSAAVFAALGGRPFYGCAVADDAMGRFYLADLQDFGVGVNTDKAINVGEGELKGTGSCAVLVTPDGERTMQTHLGISAGISEKNVDFEVLSDADWLYIEGYLAMSEAMLPAMMKLRQQAGLNGVNIAVSFADPAVVKFAKEGLLQILGNGVKIIFCNLEEAQLFTDKKQHKACVKALLEYCQIAVVTNGKDPVMVGERVVGDDGTEGIIFTEIAIPKVKKVVDTNGAGDNFAGAFMYGLSEYYSVVESGRLAGEIASRVVQQFGARLPKEKYLAIKKELWS